MRRIDEVTSAPFSNRFEPIRRRRAVPHGTCKVCHAYGKREAIVWIEDSVIAPKRLDGDDIIPRSRAKLYHPAGQAAAVDGSEDPQVVGEDPLADLSEYLRPWMKYAYIICFFTMPVSRSRNVWPFLVESGIEYQNDFSSCF